MTRPTTGEVGEALYESLEPLAWDDENQSWALLIWLGAMGHMLQPIADLVTDQEEIPPPYGKNWLANSRADRRLEDVRVGSEFEPELYPGQLTVVDGGRSGHHSFRLTIPAGGATSIETNLLAGAPRMPAMAGQEWTASAWVRVPPALASVDVYIGMTWADEDGVEVASSYSGSAVSVDAAGWTRLSWRDIAPAGTEQVGIWLEVNGAEDDLLDITDRQLQQGELTDYAPRPRPQGAPGWTILLDVDRCPGPLLPFLGLFVGVVVPIGTPEVFARQLVRERAGQIRGTLKAMRRAGQRHMTGEKTLIFVERNENAYKLLVVADADDCPDPARTEADLETQKPGGIKMEFTTSSVEIIDSMTGTIDGGTAGTID